MMIVLRFPIRHRKCALCFRLKRWKTIIVSARWGTRIVFGFPSVKLAARLEILVLLLDSTILKAAQLFRASRAKSCPVFPARFLPNLRKFWQAIQTRYNSSDIRNRTMSKKIPGEITSVKLRTPSPSTCLPALPSDCNSLRLTRLRALPNLRGLSQLFLMQSTGRRLRIRSNLNLVPNF